MKVVLVTKIKNLGNIGDIVDVKSGFARNFLLPYHKALPATEKYIKDFEEKKEDETKNMPRRRFPGRRFTNRRPATASRKPAVPRKLTKMKSSNNHTSACCNTCKDLD